MGDIALLKQVKIFAGLTDREFEDLSRRLIPVHLEKGDRLFYRHDQTSGLYIVAQGSIQIIIDSDANKEIIVYTINQGDIVGEMSIFNNKLRSATAVALEECRLFKISNEKFIELMHIYPTIAVNLCKTLVDRLLAANEMIERLGAMDGMERVTSFLNALVVREGVKDGDMYRLDNRPTYRQISNRLGVSEKTIYRTMRALAKTGDIMIKGRKLFVKTPSSGN